MSYMRCPRCGLSVRIRAAFLALEHCPRCIAKARTSVPMTVVDAPLEPASPEDHETSTYGLVITPTQHAETVRLALAGDLDIGSAPLLERHLDDATTTAAERVIIDLRELAFLDSTGLQALVTAQERLQARGQGLYLRRGRPAVQRLFELTQTVERFRFV
jgi:anti-sigma B factor antagonist